MDDEFFNQVSMHPKSKKDLDFRYFHDKCFDDLNNAFKKYTSFRSAGIIYSFKDQMIIGSVPFPDKDNYLKHIDSMYEQIKNVDSLEKNNSLFYKIDRLHSEIKNTFVGNIIIIKETFPKKSSEEFKNEFIEKFPELDFFRHSIYFPMQEIDKYLSEYQNELLDLEQEMNSKFFQLEKFYNDSQSSIMEKIDNQNKKSSEREQMQLNRKFEQEFSLDSQFKRVIEVNYHRPRESRIRLFFSKDKEEKIFTRNYVEASYSNFIHLKIEPTKKQTFASMSYGGNFKIGDNFDSGYTLTITLKNEDKKLRKDLIQILKSFGFGSLPTSYNIIAHRNEEVPTDNEALELIEMITKEMRNKL